MTDLSPLMHVSNVSPNLIDAESIRAIYSSHILDKNGALLNAAKKVASYDSYDLSFTTTCIEFFLSHSWATPGWLKTVALRYTLFFVPAVLAGGAVSLLMSTLEMFMWPLPYTGFCELAAGHDKVQFHMGYGWWLGVPVIIVVFFYGEHLFMNKLCFLDRACISQEHVELKQKGIRALGQILETSHTMLIFWEQQYFTRLWCGFELAAYISLKENNCSIILCPLNHIVFTLAMMAFHVLAAVGFGVIAPFIAWSPWVASLLIEYVPTAWGQLLALFAIEWIIFICLYVVPAPFVFSFLQKSFEDRNVLEHQLATYSIKSCACTEESDRDFVQGFVREQFGSLEAFNDVCKKYLRPEVESLLGANIVSYKNLLIMEFGHFAFMSGLLVHYDTLTLGIGNLLCFAVSICFISDMLAMWTIQRVVEKLQELTALQSRLWWLGPGVVSAIWATFTTIGTMAMAPTVSLTWKVPLVAALLIFTWWLFDVLPCASRNVVSDERVSSSRRSIATEASVARRSVLQASARSWRRRSIML